MSYDPSKVGTAKMLEVINEAGFQPSVAPSRVDLVGTTQIDGPHPEIVGAALIKAQAQDKLVFLDFYAEWCGACREMDKTTFADAAVAELLERRYVFLKVDTDAYPVVGKYFAVVGLPTAIVLSGSGEIIYRHTGPMDAQRFLQALNGLEAN